MVAGVQKFAQVVQGLGQTDFGLDNRKNMFVMFRDFVGYFTEIHLIFDEVVQLSCDAVQWIADRICDGSVDSATNIPKTRCDAVLALVRSSIHHEVTCRKPGEVSNPMSPNIISLAVRLAKHVNCDMLNAKEAFIILEKAQAVERGVGKALNRLGDVDCCVKMLSNEFGIESSLWRVARKSISNRQQQQTIDATLGRLQSDLRCLRDALLQASQETASVGGMGRSRAWTDNELHTMQVQKRSVRPKTSAGHQ